MSTVQQIAAITTAVTMKSIWNKMKRVLEKLNWNLDTIVKETPDNFVFQQIHISTIGMELWINF